MPPLHSHHSQATLRVCATLPQTSALHQTHYKSAGVMIISFNLQPSVYPQPKKGAQTPETRNLSGHQLLHHPHFPGVSRLVTYPSSGPPQLRFLHLFLFSSPQCFIKAPKKAVLAHIKGIPGRCGAGGWSLVLYAEKFRVESSVRAGTEGNRWMSVSLSLP